MTSSRVISNSLAESELLSTHHDRERRQQRQIQKIDLLRARRFGMCEPGRGGRLKYTLGGKVFIYDPRSNKAVTSFDNRDKGGESSGSKFVDPVMIEKSNEHDTDVLEMAHEIMHVTVLSKKHLWKSHTVLVVDMSGSMRNDDVDGARCRSDGVWTCLARDFVKSQLEKESTTLYDLVSVVVMRDTAEVVIRHEPTDWVLYNKIVDMREWTTLKPEGHGYYLPALQQVHSLLRINDLGSCALSVFFFSDGKPSEPCSATSNIVKTTGDIASRFGRRLTLCCVGMASRNEDFTVLEDMVKEAKAFGAVASFNRPSLDADSLSHIISSHVSSLTSTKTELTETKTGRGKTVRTDIVRERVDTPDDAWPTEDWRIFVPRVLATMKAGILTMFGNGTCVTVTFAEF
jgi:Mg-chelatase subunit ChlD